MSWVGSRARELEQEAEGLRAMVKRLVREALGEGSSRPGLFHVRLGRVAHGRTFPPYPTSAIFAAWQTARVTSVSSQS
jgi:hypothetical protein